MGLKPRVVLADDHTMLLDAFTRLLSASCEVVGTAKDGRELLEVSTRQKPDVAVVDITMPGLNGLDAARQLRKLDKQIKIVFLTQNSDPAIAAAALEEGASGYLLKDCAGSELVSAIETVMRNRTYLTPLIAGQVLEASRSGRVARPRLTDRQREVLQLLAEGYSMPKIADTLHISTSTVAHHKYKIMETLGVETTADLVRYAVNEGLSGR